VHLWDARSGEAVRTFPCSAQVDLLTFAPDRRTLASSCGDATVLIWDLSDLSRTEKGERIEQEQLFSDLSGQDAAAAYRAADQMTSKPETSLPFLREHVPVGMAAASKAVSRMMADLDIDDYDVREKASQLLEKEGPRVEKALRKALDGSPSAEVQHRVQSLLGKLEKQSPSTDLLLALRATAVLEQIASPDAHRLLREWSEGPDEASRTQEAKAALERLAERDAVGR